MSTIVYLPMESRFLKPVVDVASWDCYRPAEELGTSREAVARYDEDGPVEAVEGSHLVGSYPEDSHPADNSHPVVDIHHFGVEEGIGSVPLHSIVARTLR